MRYASTALLDRGIRQPQASARLATLVYRSRAVAPLSGPDLQGILQTSKARNRREYVTGLMLYDGDCFFQWLEGPAEGVARIMRSISRDPRHTDVEILSRMPATERMFGDWDMQLATPSPDRILRHSGVVEPDAAALAGLRRHPRRAVGFLPRIFEAATRSAPAAATPARPPHRMPMARRTEAVLRDTFLDVVVPILLNRHRASGGLQGRRGTAPHAAELAELLIAEDEGASLQLIRELRGDNPVLDRLYAPLFEPAARRLGDMWQDDACSEAEVTLGLARLQSAVRLLGMDAPLPALRSEARSVLVVPAPGEMHHFVATLDSEWLWRHGWAPQQDFPADDRALEDRLSGAWVDVLDLSLSAAFRRRDRLADLRRTIALARRASRNAALLVIVGGRVFAEGGRGHDGVGADLGSATSEHLDARLLSAAAPRA
jgi:hypothetical protein